MPTITSTDIMIYDEESDRHVHIDFAQAMFATGYGGSEFLLGDIFQLKLVSPADEAKANAHTIAVGSPAGVMNFSALKDQPTETPEQCATVAEEITKIVKSGIWCPIEIVIARPFIEHLMLSAVVAVAGKDTGATLFGPAGVFPSSFHPFILSHRSMQTHKYTHTMATMHRVDIVVCSIPAFADMQISANTSVKTIEGVCIAIAPTPPPSFSISHATCSYEVVCSCVPIGHYTYANAIHSNSIQWLSSLYTRWPVIHI